MTSNIQIDINFVLFLDTCTTIVWNAFPQLLQWHAKAAQAAFGQQRPDMRLPHALARPDADGSQRHDRSRYLLWTGQCHRHTSLCHQGTRPQLQ